MAPATRHKAITWVGVLANLLDGPYAKCLKMTVVGDNLSAHKPSAFCTVFSGEQAKGCLDRLEFVYTPKHGRCGPPLRLDMAEYSDPAFLYHPLSLSEWLLT